MDKKPVISMNVRTNQRLIDNLDYLAGKMGLSRNQLMNNLLTLGADDLLTLDKLGLIRFGVGVRSVMEKLHDQDGHLANT